MTTAELRGTPPAGRFALAAALCSNLGQTFFIGLFGSAFRADFALSESELGLLYGVATLCSGLLMFWLGAIADHLAMRRAIVVALLALAGGALLLGVADSTPLLFAALFVVRLAGQGIVGHLAVVAAGRYAIRRRGRAIAMTTYGFILGEAMFPPLVALALGWISWRTVWLIAAGLLIMLAIPLLYRLARPLADPAPPVLAEGQIPVAQLRRRELLRDPLFWRVASILLMPPLVVTAIFLHQGTLAEMLGWPLPRVASGFVLYAACQGVFAFAGGRLVDLFSAQRLLRFSLLPAALGMLSLSFASPEFSLWLLFAGLGMSVGLNAVISGGIWVELFGSVQLGMIRGVYVAMMVLSTAIGPVLFGLLFDWQVSLLAIGLGVLVYAVVVPLVVVPGIRAARG